MILQSNFEPHKPFWALFESMIIANPFWLLEGNESTRYFGPREVDEFAT